MAAITTDNWHDESHACRPLTGGKQFPSPLRATVCRSSTSRMTNGFGPGLAWLGKSSAATRTFAPQRNEAGTQFRQRSRNQIATKIMDLGFLYSLSCGRRWKLLVTRMRARRESRPPTCCDGATCRRRHIQAWGDLNDRRKPGAFIVLQSHPTLLYWASHEMRPSLSKTCKTMSTSRQILAETGRFDIPYLLRDPKSGAQLAGTTIKGLG